MNIRIDDEINSIQTLISLSLSSDLPTISLHYYIIIITMSKKVYIITSHHCQDEQRYVPLHTLPTRGLHSIVRVILSPFATSCMPGLFHGSSAVQNRQWQTRIKQLVPLATCDHPASQPTRFPPPSTSYCPVGGRPVSSSSMITNLYTSPFMLDYIVMSQTSKIPVLCYGL
jgi:hypothetical protein